MIDKSYYDDQASKFKDDPPSNFDSPRKESYIKFIIDHIKLDKNAAILLMACGNDDEKKIFMRYGYKNITGIDLHPGNGILKMDMHKLEFNNNRFDLISFSHSFEHTFDPGIVLKEVNRVLKPNGYICFEIPTHFKPNNIDRFDFIDYKTLYEFVNKYFPAEIVYGKDFNHAEPENYCWGDCCKLVIKKVNK